MKKVKKKNLSLEYKKVELCVVITLTHSSKNVYEEKKKKKKKKKI